MCADSRIEVSVTFRVEQRDGEGNLVYVAASQAQGGTLVRLYERWRARWCRRHRRTACQSHIRDGSRIDWRFALTHPF